MVYQTYSFLLDCPANTDLLFFVFFSTICSYSFHWWLPSHASSASPRTDWTKSNRPVIAALFFLGLAGSIIFFLKLSDYWAWLLFSAVITFLYSAPKLPQQYFKELRKIALGKTIFLAMVWMYVTTVLPIVISPTTWKTQFILFILSRVFLIYAICILFDYRDREDDKKAGIRSLITYLNEKSISILFIFSLAVFFLSTSWLLVYDYHVSSVIILAIPGLITALLYNYVRKNFSDMLYYFVLDGLMALSAFIMLIPIHS
jgi:4-hydroxybenzoate polyprenyltransferase